MRLDEFSFDLPASLIAQEPPPQRTRSRLMVVARRRTNDPVHATFDRLPEFLERGDVLVVNRTRVVRARLFARRSDGLEAEVLFTRAAGDHRFLGWARPLRSLRAGDELALEGDASLRFIERAGEREALFEWQSADVSSVFEFLDRFGHVPLPPYIARADHDADRERYQTVFAREPGSVAAPTAGLHFDTPLLDRLTAAGVEVHPLVLHVGPGTFQPLEKDTVEDNRLDAESFHIPAGTIAAVAAARAEGRRVIAVGTTATRTLETAGAAGWLEEAPADRAGETNLFIYPGYDFRVVDGLVTNFHLPRSSLLILICAFMGTERALGYYSEAVRQGYLFFSYGDAMLIV